MLRLLLLLLCLFPLRGVAQESLLMDAGFFFGERGTPRLEVHARIPYRALTFRAHNGGHEASFTAVVEVLAPDRRGRFTTYVTGATWTGSVHATSFAEARDAQQFHVASRPFPLAPGTYHVRLRIEDGHSRRAYTHTLNLDAPAQRDATQLSHLLLVDPPGRQARVSGLYTGGDSLMHVAYEILSPEAQRVRITREIVYQEEAGGWTSLFGLRRTPAPVIFTSSTTTRLSAGRTALFVQLPLQSARLGQHELRIYVHTEDGRLLATQARGFRVRATPFPGELPNLEEAIAQLEHIAKARDLQHIRSASTQAEKLARFEAFWARLDPTPGTARNERMEEFYLRVAQAQERFARAGSLPGWRTDPGAVLIRFGEPERTELVRDAERPTMVWYYPRIGRRFVFVDPQGQGVFRLAAPVWDDRNRM